MNQHINFSKTAAAPHMAGPSASSDCDGGLGSPLRVTAEAARLSCRPGHGCRPTSASTAGSGCGGGCAARVCQRRDATLPISTFRLPPPFSTAASISVSDLSDGAAAAGLVGEAAGVRGRARLVVHFLPLLLVPPLPLLRRRLQRDAVPVGRLPCAPAGAERTTQRNQTIEFGRLAVMWTPLIGYARPVGRLPCAIALPEDLQGLPTSLSRRWVRHMLQPLSGCTTAA